MAKALSESEEGKRARRKAAIEQDSKWNPVREAIFAHPEGPQVCPFCGQATVRAIWGLFVEEPRTASFDAWCESCGERHHCAVLLPPHAPGSFPPGTTHAVADLTKRIFHRGKKQKWW